MTNIPRFTELQYEVNAPVATVTLYRPSKRNALTPTMVNELIVAFETASADPDVGVVILTGSGDVFCSGADLSQFMDGGENRNPDIPHRGGFVELNLAFSQIGKPVIAKIQRYAYAGGLGLVAASHFAIAEDGAKFATPEINRGLFPMMIMANIFRNVSRRAGLDLVLTGRVFTADEAASIGLINRVVSRDALDLEVQNLAETLAVKPPHAMRLGLEAFYAQDHMPYEEALRYLDSMLQRCLASPDAAEGVLAFLEKREPKWR
jgi:enoyl-CoA hydratase/carnithine racemase